MACAHNKFLCDSPSEINRQTCSGVVSLLDKFAWESEAARGKRSIHGEG